MYENAKEIFYDAPMIPGAYDAIKALKKCGYHLLIISAQKEEAMEWTTRWIDDHKIKPEELYYEEDKYKLVDAFDYIIEDSPHQIINIYEASGRVIIFDYPYNKNLPLDIEMNCYRAHDWAEVIRYFLKDRMGESPLIKQIYKNFK